MTATVVLVCGTVLELFAVIGLVVMRDVYDRLHYVGLAGYGALLVAVAILAHESFSLIGDKALATGVLLVLSARSRAHHGAELPHPRAGRLA